MHACKNGAKKYKNTNTYIHCTLFCTDRCYHCAYNWNRSAGWLTLIIIRVRITTQSAFHLIFSLCFRDVFQIGTHILHTTLFDSNFKNKIFILHFYCIVQVVISVKYFIISINVVFHNIRRVPIVNDPFR